VLSTAVSARALVFCGVLLVAASHPLTAKMLCVSSSGASGCFPTIGAAVTAASANDEIDIGPGQYPEMVTVTKPLSLAGAGSGATFIDAHGLANGIYIDGLDHAGLAYVQVTGLTVQNANFEGILVTNTQYVLIADNHVANNNQSLVHSPPSCPGLPVFETSEAMDCGEGIHIVGASFTTVANNEVELNSGGILLSDETGVNYQNQIIGNYVHDNAWACGITMASHPPSPQASSPLPYGIVNNNVSNNRIMNNGLGVAGAGAGVGIFAPGPGNQAFGINVIGNTIVGNGLPGVTVHNHAAPPGAPPINLNGIVITGNYISGNGADTADAATPGTAGINVYGVAGIFATEIMRNTIDDEAYGVVMNNPGSMDVHMNNLPDTGVGLLNSGKGNINGSSNYFGCSTGPGTSGCSSVSGTGVTSSPWLNDPVKTSAPARPPLGR
jgi:parallel beta-helix repeat protein